VTAAPRGGDPGVSAREIVVGGTVPLSGVAAAYASVARGAEAYFKHVNSRGGVNGRRIRYIYYDDAYNPQQTVQQTRRLVQEDDVFAVFNALGTEHNLAIRSFLNQARVPHVFPASGATTFGRDWRRYPMTTAGFQPSYLAEGRIYGKVIGGIKRRSRVAVLYQNDDYGKDVLNGLKQGLRFYGRGGRIVGQQAYEINEVDVASQIARLRSTRADMLVLVSTPSPTLRAFIAVNRLGWRPRIIVNAVASASNIMRIAEASSSARATNGTISAVFIKDPQDPAQARTAGMRLYRSIFRRHGSGNANDAFNVYGMAAAYTFVEALKKAGRTPTRASLMRALTSLRVRNNPFVIPGVTIATSRTDRFPLETARLQRWRGGRWTTYGPLLTPVIR
jgi:branched-chain amino acid transport system substrate-binding protein